MKFPIACWYAIAGLAFSNANAQDSDSSSTSCTFPVHAEKFRPDFIDHSSIMEDGFNFRDNRRRKLQQSSGNDDIAFDSFVAHRDTHTCSADAHTEPFNTQVRGVCLGGWMVLEPWITPSLFYQFLGKDENTTAVDTYTFCEVLGAEEANKQLRRHWDTWVTEEIIQELAEVAHVTSLRLPVGDWSFNSYGPFAGCTDGSLDYIDKLLGWADKYNLSVLLDVHTMKGSQNGFDNSGQARRVEWTSKFSKWPEGDTSTFLHWPIREANWMGTFDRASMTYPVVDMDNINHALTVVSNLVERFKDSPAVLGLEPINEPWEFTPIDELKSFYFESYLIVKRGAPNWKFVMHDSFRFDIDIWGGFMSGCPDRALDTHIYQAWKTPSSRISFYHDACSWKQAIAGMEAAFGPVIVGEWSLATDNCAMFLNGFNDNVPGYPMLPCKYVPCPDPYMGTDQPGTPVDPNRPYLGPYGTGVSGPSWGLCPADRDWLKEHTGSANGTDWIHAPPEAPPDRDGTDEVMTNLARKKINAFAGVGHGFYFWNFRTDVPEAQWSYLLAVERGWIPTGSLESDHIRSACKREDAGEFVCVARSDAKEQYIRPNLEWAMGQLNDKSNIDNLHGEALTNKASLVYNEYWKLHQLQGATCDFGGTAELKYSPTVADDDEFDDDWSEDDEEVITGISSLHAVIIGVVAMLAGGLIGFSAAMKKSKRFNMAVRRSLMPNKWKNSKVFTSRNSLFGAEDMPMLVDDKDSNEDDVIMLYK